LGFGVRGWEFVVQGFGLRVDNLPLPTLIKPVPNATTVTQLDPPRTSVQDKAGLWPWLAYSTKTVEIRLPFPILMKPVQNATTVVSPSRGMVTRVDRNTKVTSGHDRRRVLD